MKILIYVQLVLGILGSALAFFLVAPIAGLSFAGGAAVTLFNFAVLVFGWPRILAKKQVAPATAAIVFKFAILGWILYLVAHSNDNGRGVNLAWFALGLATVVPSVIVTALNMPTDSDLCANLDRDTGSR